MKPIHRFIGRAAKRLEEFIIEPTITIPSKEDFVDYVNSERFLGTALWMWKEMRKYK